MSKKLRVLFLGKKCEICQDENKYTIMHHTALDANGRKVQDWWMCQLRCEEEEHDLHAEFVRGNSPKSNSILEKNNRIIMHWLNMYIAYKILGQEVPFIKGLGHSAEELIKYAISTLNGKKNELINKGIYQREEEHGEYIGRIGKIFSAGSSI
jgi:hypothetical protein